MKNYFDENDDGDGNKLNMMVFMLMLVVMLIVYDYEKIKPDRQTDSSIRQQFAHSSLFVIKTQTNNLQLTTQTEIHTSTHTYKLKIFKHHNTSFKY